ncbi:hypothetical protein KUTeg_012303 [Tegillarca granosa]|uniref:CEP63/Deup1 N-terminal domain-containing protein n=1 Tax=Tegillarca granosa TaxID=220873 RepID=A0ABQ9F4B0_TEGGR|nr:hypothetical protein KUTeg_012303 [Tegillarca granosa]
MDIRRKDYRKFVKTLLEGFDGKEIKYEIMEKIASLWLELQQNDKLPKGILASSCEAELQALIEQIDIMMAAKCSDWERQVQSLSSKLDVRERENVIHRSTIEQKNKEIGHLKQQVESRDQTQRDIDNHYNSQLSLLKSEVQKMKRDYEKLNRKHLKQAKDVELERSRSNTELQESTAQIEKLTNKLERF